MLTSIETNFIRNFKEDEKVDPIMRFIQSNKRLIIESNGSKSRKVINGA